MITFDDKQILLLRECFDNLSQWLTYLDTMSLGKTSDFERALSNMSSVLFEARKILQKGKKFLPL